MKEASINKILEAVSRGELDVANAMAQLKDFGYKDLGFAKIDNHRPLRTG